MDPRRRSPEHEIGEEAPSRYKEEPVVTRHEIQLWLCWPEKVNVGAHRATSLSIQIANRPPGLGAPQKKKKSSSSVPRDKALLNAGLNLELKSISPAEGQSSSPLEPARGTHHGNRLVHDPLADAEIVINPPLDVLVIRDLFGFETGAINIPHARDPPCRVCGEGQPN